MLKEFRHERHYCLINLSLGLATILDVADFPIFWWAAYSVDTKYLIYSSVGKRGYYYSTYSSPLFPITLINCLIVYSKLVDIVRFPVFWEKAWGLRQVKIMLFNMTGVYIKRKWYWIEG